MMFIVPTIALLLVMGMAIIRGLKGPTVYDRALAVNMFGTATVLLIAVLGFLNGRPHFTDLAFVYALLSFIGTIAILKYVAYGDLAHVSDEKESPEAEWTW